MLIWFDDGVFVLPVDFCYFRVWDAFECWGVGGFVFVVWLFGVLLGLLVVICSWLFLFFYFETFWFDLNCLWGCL